jgi:hypothetical protein
MNTQIIQRLLVTTLGSALIVNRDLRSQEAGVTGVGYRYDAEALRGGSAWEPGITLTFLLPK